LVSSKVTLGSLEVSPEKGGLFLTKPESRVFSRLQIPWTPVFTGETNRRQFFYTFPPQGGGKFFLISICFPSSRLGEKREDGVGGGGWSEFGVEGG
jgi:hypothetical protein